MLDHVKLRKAHEYLNKAIWWDIRLSKDAPTDISRYRKVELLLNWACKLELEAMGFVVYRHSFKGPQCGAVYATHMGTTKTYGDIYPEGASCPIPKSHLASRLSVNPPLRTLSTLPDYSQAYKMLPKPTQLERSWVLH